VNCARGGCSHVAVRVGSPRRPEVGAPGAGLPAVDDTVPFKDLRERWVDHLERGYVRAMLAKHGGNVSAVAQAAGLDRTYVHRLIRKHDLQERSGRQGARPMQRLAARPPALLSAPAGHASTKLKHISSSVRSPK